MGPHFGNRRALPPQDPTAWDYAPPLRKLSLTLALGAAIAVSPAGGTPATAGTDASAGRHCARLAGKLVKLTRHYPGRLLGADVDTSSTPVCFDFTGDRRDDVAFGIFSGGTAGATHWAVFRRTRSASRRLSRRYRRVAERYSGSKTRVLRRKRLLAVQTPIYKSDDANCCPTGGATRVLYRVGASRVVRVGSRTLTPREAGQPTPTERGG